MRRPPKSKSAPRRAARPAVLDDKYFRLIVQAAPSALIMVARDGTITLVNPQAEKLFGYARGEMNGLALEALVPRRYRAAHPGRRKAFHAAPAARAMGAGRDLFGLRKDGTEVPVEIGLTPLKTPEGDFVLASIIDITERLALEGRFRMIVEAAPNALLMVARDGAVTLANPQAETLFGYGPGELVGLALETLVPERFRAAHPVMRASFHAAPAARAMGAGRDLFGLRKDGTEVPIEIGLNPLKTADGDFVLASIIDITERRALERRVIHSEALASIGGMAAVLGHEIRNPLSSITMAAKAIARGDLEGEDRAHVLEIVDKEGRRLQRTLGDFLEFTRPRQPDRRLADLNAAAREILAAVRADAALVGETALGEALDAGLAPFPFDEDQVRQIVWNLVRNGLQALEGRGRLEIRTEALPGAAALHVVDDGPGIPRLEQDKIFTPFFTTKSQGTGLGLAISRNIALTHGGDLRVESAPGKGCRFTLTLPLKAR